MAEPDDPRSSSGLGQADRTLLGVAPPKLESSPDVGPRSPVFVRAGTSSSSMESNEAPLPLPRMALPSRPPPAGPSIAPKLGSELPPPLTTPLPARASAAGALRLLDVARRYPVAWMVGAPVALALLVIFAVAALGPSRRAEPAVDASTAGAERSAALPAANLPAEAAEAAAKEAPPLASGLAELEHRPPESLSAAELVSLAEARAEARSSDARALRQQLAAQPSLARDQGLRAQLLALTLDSTTARDALAAISTLEGPLGPDLLYEVWTGTATRSDATELARALVYSSDVRPKASPALAVALELRRAASCEDNRALLPRAQADGDVRSLHLLSKLLDRRGCGAKRKEDCFVCLRPEQAALVAAVKAVKARRAPSYP